MRSDHKTRERIDKWLKEIDPAEEMVWVGKNYSLAQAKRDVEAELYYLEEESTLYQRTDWP